MSYAYTQPDVAGIILAGGRSSRMGFDKLRAEVGGTPMLKRVVSSVGQLSDEVVVVGGNAPMNLPGVLRVSDAHPDYSGPLAALETGLLRVEAGIVLLCAGDMPFTSPRLAAFLVSRVAAGARAAVPVYPSGVVHPLFAAYERAVIPEVRKALAAGSRSMRAALEIIGEIGTVEYVGEGLERFGEPGVMLMNVNSPADLELARGIIG